MVDKFCKNSSPHPIYRPITIIEAVEQDIELDTDNSEVELAPLMGPHEVLLSRPEKMCIVRNPDDVVCVGVTATTAPMHINVNNSGGGRRRPSNIEPDRQQIVHDAVAPPIIHAHHRDIEEA